MKVAIVINTSWNIYNFRSGIVKALLAQGVEVIAIAPPDAFSTKLIEWGCKYVPVTIENKGSNPISDFFLLLKFFRIYRLNRPDVILHYTIKPNIYGSIAAFVLGIPTINNVSGLGTVFLHENFTATIAKKLYKFSFRFPAKIFFQNKDDLTLFLEQKLLKKDQAGLLPGSGVDTKKFAPKVTLKQNSEFTFLMVSRLLYDKGIIEYVEAIKILKKRGVVARFQVIGAIEEAANLGVSLDKVKEWEAENLLEYFPFTDNLIGFYHKADCVVLPSYREGAPRSLLEAGSCGLPMVATNVPGCRDVIVNNKNGFLCKVKDAYDLAEKMERIMNLSPEEYEEVSKFARRFILENFDEKIVINTYFSTINSILYGKLPTKLHIL